jgi:hypothetical protein
MPFKKIRPYSPSATTVVIKNTRVFEGGETLAVTGLIREGFMSLKDWAEL